MQTFLIHNKLSSFYSGNDYTHVYGADEYSGNFTGRASQFIKDNIHSCILDGEMVGFDPETKLMGAWQTLHLNMRFISLCKRKDIFVIIHILRFNIAIVI